MSFIQAHLNVELPVTYSLEACEGSKRGVLLLHGYADHARAARKRLLGLEPLAGFTVFAPNAVFPCPVWQEDRFKEAYSWYFRDFDSGAQMIPPDLSARSLIEFIEKLGLSSLQWTILAFSQGGFFAPFLIRAGLNAKTIVAVGAAYRPEIYEGLSSCQVHGIHGEMDRDVPFERAKSSFEAIKEMGYGAEFHGLPGVGHTLNDSGRAIVRRILTQELER